MHETFAFGEVAEAQARFYKPAGRTLLLASGDNIYQALLKAVELRTHGQQFDAAFTLRDQQTVHALNFSKEILRFSHDFDQRRNGFELFARMQLEFNGKKQSELGQLSAPIGKTLCDIAALASRWIVGSWVEYRRTAAMLGLQRPVLRCVEPDASIPQVCPDARADAIVVWAPEQTPESLAVTLFALEEFRRPVYVVCRPGPTYGLKAILVPPSDCERALLRAALVIDASVDTPSAALTFLHRSIRVVAARQTGAAEYAPRIRTYDPWSRRSVFRAISAAIGEPASKCTWPVFVPQAATAVASVAARPKVSLIVRTYNRPLFLERALRSVQAQTHDNLEAIVVNNGGDAQQIGEICARFSRARMISIERSDIAVAATRGMQAARGQYCGLLDDDDALFPEHVDRLCSALLRSGARAAYADSMNMYARHVGSNVAIAGYGIVFVPAIERTTMLYLCQVVGSSRMLFERDWVLGTGGFREEFTPADDYETWLRLVTDGDIVRVPAIGSLYTLFLDGSSNMSAASGTQYIPAHKALYEAYPTVRPAVEARRRHFLSEIERLGGIGRAPVPFTLDPQPLLF